MPLQPSPLIYALLFHVPALCDQLPLRLLGVAAALEPDWILSGVDCPPFCSLLFLVFHALYRGSHLNTTRIMPPHVPLCCCHHTLFNFRGTIKFDAGHGLLLYMDGIFDNMDNSVPMQLDIELSRYHEVPWWFRAYMWMCPRYTVSWDAPRPRLTMDIEFATVFFAGLNCSEWTVDLPMIPVAIDLKDLCGNSPLHFVMRQGRTVYGRFVVQRRHYCTSKVHY